PRTGARPWEPPTSDGAATTATRTVSSATTAAGPSASATTVAVSAPSPPRSKRAATPPRRTARGSPGPNRRTRCARSVACCTAGTSCAGAPCRSPASPTTATPPSCWTSPTSPPRECGDPGRRLSVPGLPRTLPTPTGDTHDPLLGRRRRRPAAVPRRHAGRPARPRVAGGLHRHGSSLRRDKPRLGPLAEGLARVRRQRGQLDVVLRQHAHVPRPRPRVHRLRLEAQPGRGVAEGQ